MASHKVLILDSNTADRTHLRQLLPNGNYEIAEAGNGQEGLALIHQERGRIRFILLDARLPQISGWEIVQHLQADPSLDHIPLVMMVEQGESMPHTTYPFLEILTKPFNRKQLKQVVKSAIQKAKAAQAQTITAPPSEPIVFEPLPASGEPQATLPAPPDATPPLPDEDLWSGFHRPHKFPDDFPEEFQHPPKLPELPLEAASGDWEAIADTTGDDLADDLEVYTTSDEDQAAVSGLLNSDPMPSVLDVVDAPDELAQATEDVELPHSETSEAVKPVATNIFEVPAVGQFTEETGVSAWDSFVEFEPELPVAEAPTSAPADLDLGLPELARTTAVPEGDAFNLEPEPLADVPDASAEALPEELAIDSAFDEDDLTQVVDFEFDSAFMTPKPVPSAAAAVQLDGPDSPASSEPFASFEADFAATEGSDLAGFSPDVDQDTELPTELMMADEALAPELPEPIAELTELDAPESANLESGVAPLDSPTLEPPDSLASNPFVEFEPELRELEQTSFESATTAAGETPSELSESEQFTGSEVDSGVELGAEWAEPAALDAPIEPSAPIDESPETFDPFADFEADFGTPEAAASDLAPTDETPDDPFASPAETSDSFDPFADFETDFDVPELTALDAEEPELKPILPEPITPEPETVAALDDGFDSPVQSSETFDPFADSEPDVTPEDLPSSGFDNLAAMAAVGAAAIAANAAIPESSSEELTTAAPVPPPSEETENPTASLKPVGQIEFNPDDRPSPLDPTATLEDIPELVAETDLEPLSTEASPADVFDEPEADPFADFALTDLDLDESSDWFNEPQLQVTAEEEEDPTSDFAEPTPSPEFTPDFATSQLELDAPEPPLELETPELSEPIAADTFEPFIEEDAAAVANQFEQDGFGSDGDLDEGSDEFELDVPELGEPAESSEPIAAAEFDPFAEEEAAATFESQFELDGFAADEPELSQPAEPIAADAFDPFAVGDDPFALAEEEENTILGDKRHPVAEATEPEPLPMEPLPAEEPMQSEPMALEPSVEEEAENTILSDSRVNPSKTTDTSTLEQQLDAALNSEEEPIDLSKTTDTSTLEQQLDTALNSEEEPEYTVLEDKREDGDFAGFAFEDGTKHNQRPLFKDGMVTLRGFEEVKMRFESAITTERIAAMQDAIAYDEPGHKLIFQALREDSGPVREAAEQIVSNRIRQSENSKPLTQQAWLKMECLQVILGHSYWVQTVAIADDNRTLVTGSKDSTIKTWDLFTGQELRTIRGHSASVLSIALSPESKKIISSSTDNTIKVWDFKSGEQVQVIDATKQDRDHKIYVVALSPDGKTLISASAEQGAKPKFENDLEGLLSYLPSKSLSPLLGVVSFFRRSREIKLWDVQSGKVRGNLLGYSKGVTDLAVTPKGDLVVSGSRDHTVKVWDLQTKRTLNTLWGHTDEIRSVTISPDGKTIVSGSRDKTIKIWDLRTGHVLRTLRGHSQSVTSVVVSPDGKTIVSGSRDATLKIWDFETGEYLNTLMGHTDLIRSVAISPDGQTIASGSRDNTIRIWRSL